MFRLYKPRINPLVVGVTAMMFIIALVLIINRVNPIQDIKAFALGDDINKSDVVFIVKDYEGRLAVFVKGDEQPSVVLDTPINILPQIDQQKLANGIEVVGSSRLRTLLEDYGG